MKFDCLLQMMLLHLQARIGIIEYQRTGGVDRTKTMGTVQYVPLKYKGMLRLYIGLFKKKNHRPVTFLF